MICNVRQHTFGTEQRLARSDTRLWLKGQRERAESNDPRSRRGKQRQ